MRERRMTRPYWWSWCDLAEALGAERDELLQANGELRAAVIGLLFLLTQRWELQEFAQAEIARRFPDAPPGVRP